MWVGAEYVNWDSAQGVECFIRDAIIRARRFGSSNLILELGMNYLEYDSKGWFGNKYSAHEPNTRSVVPICQYLQSFLDAYSLGSCSASFRIEHRDSEIKYRPREEIERSVSIGSYRAGGDNHCLTRPYYLTCEIKASDQLNRLDWVEYSMPYLDETKEKYYSLINEMAQTGLIQKIRAETDYACCGRNYPFLYVSSGACGAERWDLLKSGALYQRRDHSWQQEWCEWHTGDMWSSLEFPRIRYEDEGYDLLSDKEMLILAYAIENVTSFVVDEIEYRYEFAEKACNRNKHYLYPRYYYCDFGSAEKSTQPIGSLCIRRILLKNAHKPPVKPPKPRRSLIS